MDRRRLRRRYSLDKLPISPGVVAITAGAVAVIVVIMMLLSRQGVVSPVPEESGIRIIIKTPTPEETPFDAFAETEPAIRGWQGEEK